MTLEQALFSRLNTVKVKCRLAVEDLKRRTSLKSFVAAKRLQTLQGGFEQVLKLLPMLPSEEKVAALSETQWWLIDNYSALSLELFHALVAGLPVLAGDPRRVPTSQEWDALPAPVNCLLQEAESPGSHRFLPARRSFGTLSRRDRSISRSASVAGI